MHVTDTCRPVWNWVSPSFYKASEDQTQAPHRGRDLYPWSHLNSSKIPKSAYMVSLQQFSMYMSLCFVLFSSHTCLFSPIVASSPLPPKCSPSVSMCSIPPFYIRISLSPLMIHFLGPQLPHPTHTHKV